MITVAAGIIEKDGKILIAQRLKDDSHGLKWEFPGGTLLLGECGEECIVRELFEELGITVEVVSCFYCYNESSFKIQYYLVKHVSGNVIVSEHEQVKWVSKDEILIFDLLPGDLIVAQKLASQKS